MAIQSKEPDLILIRHSLPRFLPDVPPSEWPLSAEGRSRCKPLAAQLSHHRPGIIVSSTEVKARETARLIAVELGLTCETAAGLHEHERFPVPFFDQAQFEDSIARFFEYPDQLVYGRETANQAHQRFSQAVASLRERYPTRNLAIVAHGTVITLFVSRACGIEPFAFWRSLALPSFVVLQEIPSSPYPDFTMIAQK